MSLDNAGLALPVKIFISGLLKSVMGCQAMARGLTVLVSGFVGERFW
jgi:hypothetical protein